MNNMTVTGNVGIAGGDTPQFSNLTITGALDTKTAYTPPNGVTITGGDVVAPTLLQSSIAAAVSFSSSIANFTATQTLTGYYHNQALSITDTGATAGHINVINFTGQGISDNNSAITITGIAQDVFYINFLGSANFNMSSSATVSLVGVNASNVYWNIADGQSVSLAGGAHVSGRILDIFTNGSGATNRGVDFSIDNTTLYGSIVGGGGNNSNIVSGAHITNAMVPEVGSGGMIGAFCLLLLGSSSTSFWKRKPAKA